MSLLSWRRLAQPACSMPAILAKVGAVRPSPQAVTFRKRWMSSEAQPTSPPSNSTSFRQPGQGPQLSVPLLVTEMPFFPGEVFSVHVSKPKDKLLFRALLDGEVDHLQEPSGQPLAPEAHHANSADNTSGTPEAACPENAAELLHPPGVLGVVSYDPSHTRPQYMLHSWPGYTCGTLAEVIDGDITTTSSAPEQIYLRATEKFLIDSVSRNLDGRWRGTVHTQSDVLHETTDVLRRAELVMKMTAELLNEYAKLVSPSSAWLAKFNQRHESMQAAGVSAYSYWAAMQLKHALASAASKSPLRGASPSSPFAQNVQPSAQDSSTHAATSRSSSNGSNGGGLDLAFSDGGDGAARQQGTLGGVGASDLDGMMRQITEKIEEAFNTLSSSEQVPANIAAAAKSRFGGTKGRGYPFAASSYAAQFGLQAPPLTHADLARSDIELCQGVLQTNSVVERLQAISPHLVSIIQSIQRTNKVIRDGTKELSLS